MRIDILARLDAREIPKNKSEIRLFCKLRNELVRLPYFFDYYRRMGIDRFIFIDNGSTDGTTDYLLKQPDCHVLYTTDPFHKAYVFWQNRALDLYGTGHWCLIVDADEFFVFPKSEIVGLKKFCSFLDENKSEGVYSFMLDMYAQGDITTATHTSGQSPLEVCPFHDSEYKFVRRTILDMARLPNRPPPFPDMEVIGGPRMRLFYPRQNSTRFWPRVMPRLMGQFLRPFAKIGLIPKNWVPHMSSMLFKVPLIKWKAGLTYYASTHIVTPIKLSNVTSVLLHFKYFSDFEEKAIIEALRGVYHDGGSQYRRYAKGMKKQPGENGLFFYEGSVKYGGSESLIHLGLMRSCADLDSFARK